MLIAHTADWHIGKTTHGITDPKTGMNTRLLEQRRTAEWIRRTLVEREVDAVVFAGDVGERRALNGPELQTALHLSQIAQLFGITGNHDNEWHASRTTTVVAASRAFVDIPAARIRGDVNFIGIPYPSRAALAAANVGAGQVSELVAQVIAKSLRPGMKNVVVGHFSIAGAKYNAEQDPLLMSGSDVVIDPDALLHPDVLYVALGHLHNRQCASDARINYCGSPMMLDFGEQNDAAKGIVLFDTDTCEFTFVENPYSPKFFTVDEEGLAYLDEPGAYVRIRTERVLNVNERMELTDMAMKQGLRLRSIEAGSARIERSSTARISESQTDSEIVTEWAKAHEVSDSAANALVALMKEVDAHA